MMSLSILPGRTVHTWQFVVLAIFGIKYAVVSRSVQFSKATFMVLHRVAIANKWLGIMEELVISL